MHCVAHESGRICHFLRTNRTTQRLLLLLAVWVDEQVALAGDVVGVWLPCCAARFHISLSDAETAVMVVEEVAVACVGLAV